MKCSVHTTNLGGVGEATVARPSLPGAWCAPQTPMPAILELINPDGISYIAVAQHWAAGRFAYAINAYWSPFFSWAMVPWLLLGVPPVPGAKVTLFLAAAVLVAGGWKLVGIISTDQVVRWPATALLALLALEWSLTVVTPDVIAVAIFVWYLVALDRLRRPGAARDDRARGAPRAVLFLVKAGGAPPLLSPLPPRALPRPPPRGGGEKGPGEPPGGPGWSPQARR